MVARRAEKRLVEAGALEPQMDVVVPGEADAAMHQHRAVGAARVDVAEQRFRHRGGSSSATISAAACLSAWNDPIGLPNCSRALEYSTAIASARSIPPSESAAIATAPVSSSRA